MEQVIAFEAPPERSNGYGSGYGYGYGDGSGDGSNLSNYYAAVAHSLAGSRATAAPAVVALWKSNKHAWPANGGSGTNAVPGLIEETAGPLELCKRGTLHATFVPRRWQGGRLWVVALYGELAVDHEKLGALKREIICEIPMFHGAE